MKYLQTLNENKSQEGDALVSKIIDIAKKENIKVEHQGGYKIEIDDKIYVFSDFGRDFPWSTHDCTISVYNTSQKIITKEYGEIVSGEPISRNKISTKSWKNIEELYKIQKDNNMTNILSDLDDVNRSSKKFGL